jgi:hypothetical protein
MEGAGTTTSGGAEAARGMRQEGYFGFLDALGIRGRWQVDPPTKIVSDYEEWYTRVTAVDSATGIGSLDHVNEAAIPRLRGAARPGLTTRLWAFSDTVALSLDTHGAANPELSTRLGNTFAEIFVGALLNGFLLRGAVSFGEYYQGQGGRILVGPAVDEAAEWHEQVDWAGIVLTPSAGRTFIPDAIPNFQSRSSGLFLDYPVPMKSGGSSSLWAFNWPQTNRDSILAMVDRHFMRPPVTPAVARKRQNTLDFFQYSRDYEERARSAFRTG